MMTILYKFSYLSFVYFYFAVAAEKTARLCSDFAFFSFVYFLCVGIPILKIILSHAHKWVTSGVIL